MAYWNRVQLVGAAAIVGSPAACATTPSGRTGVECPAIKGAMNRTTDEGNAASSVAQNKPRP